MKKYLIIFATLGFCLLGAPFAKSQTSEPPSPDLPIGNEESATATATGTIAPEGSATIAAEATTTVQEFVDDAETGSEIIILAILSLVAGVGLFFIKKYFDLKRYTL